MKALDLTGRRFGRLTALALMQGRQMAGGVMRRKWQCRCDCGTLIDVLVLSLTSGNTCSCGCLWKESITSHGHAPRKNGRTTPTKEYATWASMWDRCRNPNNDRYQDYGGRGINVCDRWKDFAAFLEDMGAKPEGDFSIDRIDNAGDYEPHNCRWATRNMQQHNKRVPKNNTTGATGIYRAKRPGTWVARITVNGKNVHLGIFETIDAAINARENAEQNYWRQ